MSERAKIIFIHGASSSGKSTLARAVQSKIDEPFWHVSIDHLRDSGMLPSARFKDGDFDWTSHRGAFFDGFHHSLVAYAAAGNNLILEHILEEPEWSSMLAVLFQPFDVFLVALHADLADLVQREAARGDRRIGSAADDFHRIHEGQVYDLELAAGQSPAENACRLIAAWKTRSSPSVFERLAQQTAS